MRVLLVVSAVLVLSVAGAVPAQAAHVLVVDGFLKPRPMPRVATPIAFSVPDGCELYARVQTSQMSAGEDGMLIHWMARCGAAPGETTLRLTRALDAQGWTLTASERSGLATYFRDDLELVLAFDADGRLSSSVWLGQRYWR